MDRVCAPFDAFTAFEGLVRNAVPDLIRDLPANHVHWAWPKSRPPSTTNKARHPVERRTLPSEVYIPRLCTCGLSDTGAGLADQPDIAGVIIFSTRRGQIGHILWKARCLARPNRKKQRIMYTLGVQNVRSVHFTKVNGSARPAPLPRTRGAFPRVANAPHRGF